MLSEVIKGKRILLASASPRRQELFRSLGINFEVRLKKGIEEDFPSEMDKSKVAEYLAELKANAYRNELKSNEILITADTVVRLGDEILGKPENKADAIKTLSQLSDNEHFVETGVCLMSIDYKRTFTASTKVYFKKLKKEEINYYIAAYKPFDKAGAYGIQEWIGLIGIRKIEGSYYNVVGLPTQILYEELEKFILRIS